ncbi:MAG: hypothetical protein EYC68_02830 [Chloroflexota bacterium]|nr:MAG: hypothetical protein EYC68_02830 [Chloroflexota bacterium]
MTRHANSWQKFFAWTTLVISGASFLLVLYISLVLCPPTIASTLGEELGSLPAALAFVEFALLCILIVTFRPENRIGWLCGVISIGGAIVIPVGNYQYSCYSDSGPVPPELAIGIFVSTILFFLVIIPLMFTLLPLWFPNGQFLSPRWRAFWYVALGLAVGSALMFAFSPGALAQMAGRPIASPFELDIPLPAWVAPLQRFFFFPALVLPLIANASLVVRYRRADAVTRQQLKVFGILAVGGVMLLLLVELAGFAGLLDKSFGESWFYLFALIVGWLGYPTAIGVAVLRYRLYDIEVIIRRTLIYGVVTGMLVALYFGLVILFQRIFAGIVGESTEIVTVVSTLIIAALFTPLRNRVQAAIDRRFYRKKYDAQKVLQKFSETVRDETDIDKLTAELVNVVNETMQPRSVSLWLKRGDGETGRQGYNK